MTSDDDPRLVGTALFHVFSANVLGACRSSVLDGSIRNAV